MPDIALVIEAAGALSAAGGLGYAKTRSPRVFWSLVGASVARVRFSVTYRATMDVCGLTVQPSRLRAFMVRNVARRQDVQPVPPTVRRVRYSSTGMRATLRLPAGLEPADVSAASERLRHAWGVHSVHVVEVKPGFVELRMTGYDVLRRVKMPRRLPRNTAAGPLVVPVALREDGTAFVRDYQKIPHSLTVGANQSGKSMYQRNLISELAKLPVGLIGIDCKRGVEQRGYAPRLSALAVNPDEADGLLEALVGEMEERFDLLSSHGVPDMWGLPAKVRPVPLVVLVDEVAELFLVAAKKDEERRDRMVMRMIRLAQMARAVGIFLEVCGQRFGSDLGKGATALRAQLTGRVVHRVNDKQTAEMALGDIAPEAVFAATTIAPDRPGVAVAGDASGGWSRIRTPAMTPADAVAVCQEYAHLTPHITALAPFRPTVHTAPAPAAPLLKPRPVTE
ncbi:FtsK/SpoIIIE domain-containing protein [Streptomyces sp. NBC_01789]|uniref:FtsK/SpoIIIE domain-containing protein n=1 Tax=Streptomyces sp. NBC_01789 TaxID=2975941 RepID=UPI002255F404|nr:FtsK/SpoIIIE domain-containing protein [Streptomyces sp. NBC_01789]MCX4449338.1 FtsK/SpoIIIE domain-containing protein [Streptomyces sp. NBC_01789]